MDQWRILSRPPRLQAMTADALPYTAINSAEALSEYAAQVADKPTLFVDTEFLRERTYWPELCLVQVSDGEQAAVIDPLAFDAAAGLRTLLGNPKQVKVFHAAGQDLDVLHRHLGIVPAPLFDTQLAASLLGYGEQIGYGALVERTQGVALGKAFTRLDWSKRPLPDGAMDYAVADVVYLAPAYAHLQQELAKLGRSDWLTDDFAALADPARFESIADDGWRKLKGIKRLRPNQQQAAARLAIWRERKALDRNLPRKWVAKDDVLLDMARRKPTNLEQLKDIRGLDGKAIGRDGQAMLDALHDKTTHIEALDKKDERILPAHAEPTVDVLMGVLRYLCNQAQISPNAVANKTDVAKLLAGERDIELAKSWRKKLAGGELIELTDGRSIINVGSDGSLEISQR